MDTDEHRSEAIPICVYLCFLVSILPLRMHCCRTVSAAMPGQWRPNAIVVINRHWLARFVRVGLHLRSQSE